MKKVDLHIHTVKTISDSEFEFSMDCLVQYVEETKLDAIAITNHNFFDKEQFIEISERLNNIVVFPGIEINVGITSAGHMLVIDEKSNIEVFGEKCDIVRKKINKPDEFLSLDDLKQIFGDLNQYLLIPHYEKNPKIDNRIINDLISVMKYGEVSSIKKFIYCKNENRLTPLIFSDWRPTNNSEFPIKQTYVDTGDLSLKSLKKSLRDNSKVQLSEKEGKHLFQVLPDLQISTGLTVIIGGRSSGKSYTLDRIFEKQENIKYIRQFDLLEKDSVKAEDNFTKSIESEQSIFIQEYFRSFALVLSEIRNIDLREDEKCIDDYLKSLKEFASKQSRTDAFSKCKLFNEVEFSDKNLSGLEKLISSVETLLDSREYKSIIDKSVHREQLINLHKELIKKHVEENILVKKKKWINDLLDNIKSGLQAKSAMPRIKKIDLYNIQMNRKKVEKFNRVVDYVKTEKVIQEKDIEGFKIQVLKRKFKNASELKKQSGKKMAFKEAYNSYDGDAYNYLKKLEETEVMDKDYYQFFSKIDYNVLNQYGYLVSGGERAEYNLLREINDALQYDMLLIDEPESSFDNIFLKNKVNHLIKEISKNMPVVIVTHNNTVGASIQPDYIVHTKREIKNGKAVFKIYSGFPGDHFLTSLNGDTIQNIDVTLDCLEAGRDAYEERKKEYEILDN